MNKIFFGGVCALALTMGISRFTYTPLLPVMQNETLLGIASGGWLATIHYFGYLFGVLTTLKTVTLRSRELFYFFGLLMSVLSTFAMALAENFLLWSVARFIAGFSGAAGIIVGAGLVMQWITENTNQKPQMGKFFAGAGIGIVISALGSMLFKFFNLTWDHQWIAYGIFAIFLFLMAWILRPKLTFTKKNNIDRLITPEKPTSSQLVEKPKGLYKLLFMYFSSGFAFVISATFTVSIVKLNPEIQHLGDFVWLLVGLASVPSVLIWDKVEAKFGMLSALCFAIAFHSISLFLNALSTNLFTLLVAAFLFGVSNLGIVSLTMTLAGRVSPKNPGKEMARLTVAFAIALIVGPSFAATLAEIQGTFKFSLLFSASMLAVGIFLLLLRENELG